VVLRFVSLGWPAEARLNQVRIQDGRLPRPGSSEEVVVSASFAETWHLSPGSSINAVVNGRLARLRIVGTGISPEFVWATDPRKGMPDPWHFGIAWMDGDALAKATGLVGAFDDAVLELAAGADERAVIDAVDRLLEPYGGLGAIGRADHPSAKLVTQKLAQLWKLAKTLPVVFLGVAAFLLHVLVGRIVASQREQIATLKALGYRTMELFRHYVELTAAICVTGAMVGWVLGALGTRGILKVYAKYFHFPAYLFRLDARTIVMSSLVAVGAGLAATAAAVHKAVSIPPAEAMRPEAPPAFRPTFLDRVYARVAPVVRMVLRDAQRRPMRLLLSAGSIALATAIVVAGSVLSDSMAEALRLQFEVSHREQIVVTLDRPRPWRAVRDAAHLSGVQAAEGERLVPVRLRAGHRTRTTAVLGTRTATDLHQLLDTDARPMTLPSGGLCLSRPLGESLGVRAGDAIDLEVLEGDRQRLRVPVAALVDDLLGLFGYMSATELATLLGEEPRANLVLLAVERRDVDEVVQRLGNLPAVAAISRPDVDRGLVHAQVGDVFAALEAVLAVFATVIAVAVVYNNARIALDVRSRDLATLRILGFTRGELAFILLGEQAIQVALGVVPGLALGRKIGGLALGTIDRELLRLPVTLAPRAYLGAACTVLLAALLSALVVRARSDKLDLVSVLKARD
jgi:putative ABC transport system permease protein